MNPLLVFPVALLGALGWITAALVLQLCRISGRHPFTTERIDELSIDRYRPMLRLLDEEEFRFLSAEPGSNARLLAKVRRQRRQLFRAYLQSLEKDFRGVCSAVKLAMVQSQCDRPDLATTLLRAQWTFAGGMLLVRCRLAAYSLGLATVDVRDLIRLFDGMRVELRTLVPATAGSMA